MNRLDPRVLGLRLIEARKARAATQEDVATYLGCSRPTYIAMEKGERAAKAEEIVRLAAYFGRSVHDLVRPGEPAAGLQPHLRAVVERTHEHDREDLLQATDERPPAAWPRITASWSKCWNRRCAATIRPSAR